MGHDGLCLATLARLGRFFFGQAQEPGLSLSMPSLERV